MKSLEERKAALLNAKKNNKPNIPNETFIEPINGPAFQYKRLKLRTRTSQYSGGMRRDGDIMLDTYIPDPFFWSSYTKNPHGLRSGVIFYDKETNTFEKVSDIIGEWFNSPELEELYNSLK